MRTLMVISVGAFLLIAGEFGARMAGFGNPPIYVMDPDIEYYLAPNGIYERFGQAILTNRYGMRSDDIDLKSAERDDVFSVFGDSVIYGTLLDQSETVPARLQTILRRNGQKAAVVNSIAASSWGPENLLAFYRRFGPFPGNTAWVIQSTHDMVDVIDASDDFTIFNSVAPYGAFHDLSLALWRQVRPLPSPSISYEDRRRRADSALHELIMALKRDYVRVVLVHHLTRSEAQLGPSKGETHFRSIASSAGVSFASTLDPFRQAYKSNQGPHLDDIHPSKLGAELIANVLIRSADHN